MRNSVLGSSLLTNKYVIAEDDVNNRDVHCSIDIDMSDPIVLKEFCRQAKLPIDHPLRSQLWAKALQFKCGATDEACPCCRYEALSHRLFGRRRHLRDESGIESDEANTRLSIPSFVDPVYCNTYRLNEEGQAALSRILFALKYERPFIMHAPLLHPITSLLLHYYEENKVFAMVCRLIANKYEYITLTQAQWSALCELGASLVRKYCSRNAYECLKVNKFISHDKLFTRWADWLFGSPNGLVFTDIVHICDCYFVEGIKILMRSIIAIVRIATEGRSPLLSKKHPDDQPIFTFIKSNSNLALTIVKKGTVGVKNLRKKYVTEQLNRLENDARNSFKNLPLKQASLTTDPMAAFKGSISRRLSSAALHREYSLARFANFHNRLDGMVRDQNLLVVEDIDTTLATRDDLVELWMYLPCDRALYKPKLI
ncbi:hypothetical protein ACOME3_009282 [Neoechinorhynchus agilis]